MSQRMTTADAKASAAFERYAKACERLRETQRPSDALAARRAYGRFLEAFLPPEERAQVEAAAASAFRGRQ